MSDLEYLDVKEMTFLFGWSGGLTAIIGNIMIDVLKEDELWENWVTFYQRTYLTWLNSSRKETTVE